MQKNIQGKINEITKSLHEIADHFEDLTATQDIKVALTTTDIVAVEVNDLIIDVYNKNDMDSTLANVCLYDLLQERLDIYGINRHRDIKFEELDDGREMYDFKMHLLNIMLLRAYDIWKMKYKDAESHEFTGFSIPSDINWEIVT